MIYLTCLVFLKSSWWVVWIFCAPTTYKLKNKIMKIEHKKIICGSSKTLKNISWPINICLKYFMTPINTHCVPPTYLMYGPCINHYLLMKKTKKIKQLPTIYQLNFASRCSAHWLKCTYKELMRVLVCY